MNRELIVPLLFIEKKNITIFLNISGKSPLVFGIPRLNDSVGQACSIFGVPYQITIRSEGSRHILFFDVTPKAS